MEHIDKFDRLCTQIFFYNSQFHFPFDSIIHDGYFEDIVNSEDYPLLEGKMKNLIALINQDREKIFEDTTILWEII